MRFFHCGANPFTYLLRPPPKKTKNKQKPTNQPTNQPNKQNKSKTNKTKQKKTRTLGVKAPATSGAMIPGTVDTQFVMPNKTPANLKTGIDLSRIIVILDSAKLTFLLFKNLVSFVSY